MIERELYEGSGRDDASICDLYDARVKDAGLIRKRLIEVRDTYNGDIALPVPELDRDDKPAIPNLVKVGIDGTSERIASVAPSIFFPPDADGDSKLSRKRARQRADVVREWRRMGNADLKLYRRARYFSGYGRFVSFVRPSGKYEAPCYELRDPLSAYPSDEPNEDFSCGNIIFANTRSALDVAETYGDEVEVKLAGILGKNWQESSVELIEYLDDEEWITLARMTPAVVPGFFQGGKQEVVRLERIKNRIDRMPVVLGGHYGLSRTVGQFDGMVGIYWTQAKLQALEVIAVTKDVFPNVWVEGQNGQNPQVVVEADGMRGIRGELRNGTISVEQSHPGYMTPTTIDRLERNARVAGRIPPEYAGETGSNIRTGRRGDAVMSATVDFVVQEAQRIFARSMTIENELAIAIDKAYWGPQTKTIWLGTSNSRREDQYVPEKLWTTDRHEVSYTHAGSDANSLTIGLLQLNGAGIISKHTTRMQHPMVEDGEREHDLVQVEALEGALLASLEAQAQQGALPAIDLANIMKLIGQDDVDLAEAVVQAQKMAQERQAQQAPPESPEAQPGLAMPGAGAEAGGAPIPEVPAGMRNLQSLLGATRLTNMRTPNEMATVGNVNAMA